MLGGRMGGCGCSEDHLVDRYTMSLEQKISEQNSMLALRDANLYQDQKTLELYRYIDGKIEGINAQLCQQAVINAQLTANISCMQRNLDVLNGLTKTVIPVASICPEVMPRYNSFTVPTTDAAAGG